MAKSEYTDQHITPQAYLNRFAWKGDKEYIIGVWQKGKKGVEPKLYENAVKNVGYIKNFYDVGSRKDKKYWEKYYGRVFDPLYGKPLGNLIAKITLSRKESFYLIESEKRLLARIICSQMLRGPNYINKQLDEGPSLISANKNLLIRAIEGNSSPKVPQIIERIKNLEITDDQIKDVALATVTDEERLNRYSAILLERAWAVYYNTTFFEFLTSDCPVIQYNLLNNSTDEEHTGIARLDTALIFTLTPYIMIHILPPTFSTEGNEHNNGRLLYLGYNDLKFILNYNSMQLEHCHQQAFMSPFMKKTIEQMMSDIDEGSGIEN